MSSKLEASRMIAAGFLSSEVGMKYKNGGKCLYSCIGEYEANKQGQSIKNPASTG